MPLLEFELRTVQPEKKVQKEEASVMSKVTKNINKCHVLSTDIADAWSELQPIHGLHRLRSLRDFLIAS